MRHEQFNQVLFVLGRKVLQLNLTIDEIVQFNQCRFNRCKPVTVLWRDLHSVTLQLSAQLLYLFNHFLISSDLVLGQPALENL